MKREKKTDPSDYPIFAFRVSKEEKETLNSDIEQVALCPLHGIDLAWTKFNKKVRQQSHGWGDNNGRYSFRL